MPTPDYTRGWKAALAEAADQFDVAGWRTQAGHLRALDREASIAAAYAAEPAPACRVGGPPPVPGIGWGLKRHGHVYAITHVCVYAADDWTASVTKFGKWEAYESTQVTALYRPGDAADAPCWRRE